MILFLWLTYHPVNYNDVVRFAQFVINIRLRTTNHKNSQLKGKNKWKIYLPLRIVTRDVNENLTKLQGEGRMVRKKPTRKSDRVTLYAFARWLVSSKRGGRVNFAKRTPISLKGIRRPSTHDLTTSGKTSATWNSVVQLIRKQCPIAKPLPYWFTSLKEKSVRDFLVTGVRKEML